MYPSLDISFADIIDLHSKGLTDSQIAIKLGATRVTILRRRKEIGLQANRAVGDRGPSVKPEEPYWQAVRRALRNNDVAKYIRAASRDHYKKTHDWDRFFIATVLEPRPMFHAIPGPYASHPEKMYLKHTRYITRFEKMMGETSLAGVPGPAILELIQVCKSADEETCMELARKAVEGAGYVNSFDTVEKIELQGCVAPEEYNQHWEEKDQECDVWTPNQLWEPVKKIAKAWGRAVGDAISRTGRRGRGGGTQSLNNHLAFQGIKGQ